MAIATAIALRLAPCLRALGTATRLAGNLEIGSTIYWGDPDTMVLVLGWWEVAIGVCIIIRPLLRIAILLLTIRLPGIILAFILKTDVCFYDFPFAPTPEGQFLIKDLAIFLAALAIAGSLSKKTPPGQHH